MRQGLRQRLADRAPLFGLFVNYPSPALVELAGRIGYDWVFIDAEHGPLDLETCENMVRAAETAGIVPIVRMPNSDPLAVNRFLDTGAMGVLVPHLSSAAVAREIVDAAKYHPMGHRGAGSRTRAADYGFGAGATDYAAWANAETMIFGILEDEGVQSDLDAVLEVDGLDGFVVGPSDLAQSLGLPGKTDHPTVLDAVDRISQRVLRSGRTLCRVLTRTSTSVEDAKRFVDMGVPMIAEPYTGLFARGARDILAVPDSVGVPRQIAQGRAAGG